MVTVLARVKDSPSNQLSLQRLRSSSVPLRGKRYKRNENNGHRKFLYHLARSPRRESERDGELEGVCVGGGGGGGRRVKMEGGGKENQGQE